MRLFLKRINLILLASALLPILSVSAYEAPDISAQAAVLYCPETKEFLYERSADERLSMASTTKIMTALLALEYCRDHGDKLVKITEAIANTEGSSMGLEAGDEILLSQLCAGMMLASGNDAANAAAQAISDDFQSLMNSRAKELEMFSTNFVTPSGLDAEEHYSTARDMAMLAAEALRNEEFVAIASSKAMTLSFNSGKKNVTLENHNKLLWYMEDCIGVKTGYTQKSGRCLVSAVRRDDLTLICVTLNAPDDWNDHMNLCEYAESLKSAYSPKLHEFILPTTENYIICTLENSEKICYFSTDEIEEVIYLPKFIYASENQKGNVVGRAEYISKGKTIATRNIIIS